MERSITCGSRQSTDRVAAVPRVLRRGGLLLWAGTAALSMQAAHAQAAETEAPSQGLKNGIVFTEYSSLASTAEMLRRLCSPLNARRLGQNAERAGQTLQGQPIDLAKERYSVYVPVRPHSPSGTYSLLVFIPPWTRAEVPRPWIPVLNRYNTILVTAEGSGNDAPTIDRREPLALLAAHNVMAQYPVDPQQVFVGGFSGGARVALRLALGYPDLFHGALLDAGSDPIGTADVPLPPADLFHRFQVSSRLVYLTGERDEENLADEAHSRRSLEKWCVADVLAVTEPRTGHELAGVAAFGRSLEALVGVAGRTQTDKLAACREHLDTELNSQLEEVESAFARGESGSARQLLGKVDDRFGGLAAPRSVELAGR
jgi:pimeloyl-ACP methyl ester carboxylesterase